MAEHQYKITNGDILEKELETKAKKVLEHWFRDYGMTVQFWEVTRTKDGKHKGIILCHYHDGKAGLYQLVGQDGDNVIKDLEFLKSL